MDDDVHFRCGSSEVISGLESYYNNWYHDRIWKATCVALNDTMKEDVMLTYEGLTDHLNGLKELFQYEANSAHVLTGIASDHNSRKKDRIFKVHEAELNNGLTCTDSSWSD